MTTTFGDAIAALKEGKRVKRSGWNGNGMFLQLSKGLLPCETIEDNPEVNVAEMSADNEGVITHIENIPVSLFTPDEGGNDTVLPCLQMSTVSGSIVNGWLASQSDMLAEDWQVFEN